MNTLTLYQLIYQLIQSEKRKLWSDIDSVDVEKILTDLRAISDIDCGEGVENWVKWFVGNGKNNAEERESIDMMWRIHIVEQKSLKKIQKQLN